MRSRKSSKASPAAVLNTSNPFVKLLWVSFILILISFFLHNVFENINDCYQYTVITTIEYMNEFPMTLPAINICLSSLQSYTTNATLYESLVNCTIDKIECYSKDFYSFEARTSYSNDIITCYVLNGGRNSYGHFNEIKSTRSTGPYTGFEFFFSTKIPLFVLLH